MDFYKQEGFILTVFISFCLFLISVLIHIKPDLFVPNGQDVLSMGGDVGLILAIGLLLKWKHIRYIVLIVLGIYLIIHFVCAIKYFFVEENISALRKTSWVIFTLFESTIMLLLILSKSLRVYLGGKQKTFIS